MRQVGDRIKESDEKLKKLEDEFPGGRLHDPEHPARKRTGGGAESEDNVEVRTQRDLRARSTSSLKTTLNWARNSASSTSIARKPDGWKPGSLFISRGGRLA